MKVISTEDELRAYYQVLFQAWGRQHWWLARTRFEVFVGAYLTQNTALDKRRGALRSLRASGLLPINDIRRVPLPQLTSIRSRADRSSGCPPRQCDIAPRV